MEEESHVLGKGEESVKQGRRERMRRMTDKGENNVHLEVGTDEGTE